MTVLTLLSHVSKDIGMRLNDNVLGRAFWHFLEITVDLSRYFNTPEDTPQDTHNAQAKADIEDMQFLGLVAVCAPFII
jgi:hypothetical protein